MKLTRNVFTVADLNSWLEDKTLRVNHEYQRSKGLWPVNARTYFIDTILNDYPFPKITIRQTIDLTTRESIREIIDGQQRMMTIEDFINDQLVLTKVSKRFQRMKFSDLEEEVKNKFLAYEVSVDTVIGAPQDEVLEIFRRINSYTLPLNEPEKRHASYQGLFKWFIMDWIVYYTPMFETYNILSLRDIARMMDADLMTELCQVLINGVLGRWSSKLDQLYKMYDQQFEDMNIIETRLKETLDFIKIDLNRICESRVLRGYSLYSLFSALVYNRWGIGNINRSDVNVPDVIGQYTANVNMAIQNILELFNSVDQRDIEGRYAEFVLASTGTTHSIANRKIRLKWMVAALQNML